MILDASPVSLCAILMQVLEDGPHAIRYARKSLTDVGERIFQTEKEALALVWACEKFKMYLIEIEFDLISDHKPLEVIVGVRSKPCALIERWVLRLQPFKYRIVYKPGKANIPDPLSRLIDTTKKAA